MSITERRFEDRVAVVTGAARGIGAQVATRLAAEGAAVAAFDINVEGAKTIVKRIADTTGGKAHAFGVDLRSSTSIDRALDEVESVLGTVQLTANCAGIIHINRFLELPESHWDDTLAVNLKGTFLFLQAAARRMVASGTPGRMVAISSIGGRGPRPDCADYAVSKAGVISLIQSAAVALAPYGIIVNAICPGIVDTPMTALIHEGRGKHANITGGEALARAIKNIPLGRIETPDDVANAILFFLSDDASYITGQALNVSGGLQFN